jgi:mannose-6-phosphate isomerase-like protein (cupin superfamily)
VDVHFVSLRSDAAGAPVPFAPCSRGFVAVADGFARIGDDRLEPGDMALVDLAAAQDVSTGARVVGEGVVLVGVLRDERCAPRSPGRRLYRAALAEALVWAQGSMRAYLTIDDAGVSPPLYIGRLEGTAPVAEHAHAESWEVLAASEGAGEFTLGGAPRRLKARDVVYVPPATPHSWKPDNGKVLFAIQFYSPSGPERRFRQLADAAVSEATGSGRP